MNAAGVVVGRVGRWGGAADDRYAGLAEDGWGGLDADVGFVLAIPCSVLSGERALRAVVQFGHGLFDDR